MSGSLKREFTLWSAFAFAFAFISPIVALYGIFGLAYSTAGPGFWWNFLLVFGGQLLVAMIFAELVSKWPVEGSIYQWTRRLSGTGTPEMGGLSSRELLAVLRGLKDCHVVGGDVVEVAPAYDHAEITGIAASHLIYEMVSLVS